MGSTGNRAWRKRKRQERKRQEQQRRENLLRSKEDEFESWGRLPNQLLLALAFCSFIGDASTILLWWPQHRWIGGAVFAAGSMCACLAFVFGKEDTDA